MSIVIAVDPGGTTGLAFWDLGDNCITMKNAHRERPDTLALADLLLSIAETRREGLQFVVEEYKITARTAQLSQQHTALELIGIIKWIANRNDCGIAMQRPGDAKRFATDKRLKQAGLWTKGGGGHANDAARHLFLWLCKHGHINAAEVDGREG